MFSDQQHGERADQFGRPVEAIGDLSDLAEQIAGPVGVGLVVEVARVQHSVQQLLLGFEVMQQSRGGDPGFAGDLGQRGVAPAVAREEPLRDRRGSAACGPRPWREACRIAVRRAPDSFDRLIGRTNLLNTQ